MFGPPPRFTKPLPISLVYLAGPITGCSYEECTDWREYVDRKLPEHIIGVSPMRQKNYLNQETSIGDEYQTHLSCAKGITCRDHYDCSRCDMILANFEGAERASIGTVMEIAWGHSYNKPIVAVMDEKNVHWHAMIRETAGFIVPTLSEAIDVVSAVLTPGA